MDSISNSGVSLILNPDIAHAIDNHQHDLSTCEEEFENPEEIQQMLANAFDSQSLSNTDNDEHPFDDDEDEDDQDHPVLHHLVGEPPAKPDDRLQEENDELRRRLAECTVREELARKRALDSEREINELNERHEQKLFTLRLDYETKSEQLNNQLTDQQLEMLTLRQKCEMLVDEKCLLDERINDIRSNEQQLKVELDGLQMENEQLIKKIRSKPLTIIATTQTDTDNRHEQRIEELTRVIEQMETRRNQCEQKHSIEKNYYEARIKDLSKRPLMAGVKLQTDPIEEEESKKLKQIQNELDDYKLKVTSKQIEINTLKFDLDQLKQEMNDRLSLLNTNISTEQMTKVLGEREEYLNELSKLRAELPELKQQMIDSFQTKVITFKEQVKKSLLDKENEYRKRIEQMENEYISQYEQVLEKNKQVVRAVIAAKQEEFNAEKAQMIAQYDERFVGLQKQQLSDDERRAFEQKIDELTRANEKCSQYIAKREHEHRHREKSSLQAQHHDEIHRLYDQIAKQNHQQIQLIDEHQKQIEQLKTNYDQRYRILLDEWKIYNNDLHQSNTKLKSKLKDYEKTIVQLRYHIINLQIEYLQNGGNANKILPMCNEMK